MSKATSSASGANCRPAEVSFYSITSPTLVTRIQNKIRVQWHWDRDDEVDPRSADPAQLMRRGCHMIVQMQVAERQGENESSVSGTDLQQSENHDSEDERGDCRSEKKQKLTHSGSFSTPSQISERVCANPGASAAPRDRICLLDDLPEEFIWSNILTPTVLSRATILLPHSARFHRLFYNYYDLFIAQQQSEHEWRTNGCPVWLYRFDLNLFHSRLDALRSVNTETQQGDEDETNSSITECVPVAYTTPLPASLEWDLLRRWRRKIATEYDISSIPRRFPIYIANYSNSSCTSSGGDDNSRWQGDLLVLPLRTIHAVLDASPLAPVMRLKFFLGFYSALPSHQPRDHTGFAIGHGPGRHEARAFERQRIEEPSKDDDEHDREGEQPDRHGNTIRAHTVQQWKQIRLDQKAWRLWNCDNTLSCSANQTASSVHMPIGQQVQLIEKSSEEVDRQRAQSSMLLQDLERDSCSLLHGVFPPSLYTASKTLHYLHDLMQLPPKFCLTSLSHARAFHDGSLRKLVGLESHHLRRDADQFGSTHVQASHGNTAYGAYSAGAVEAALFLEPFVDIVWNKWNLGQHTSQSSCCVNPDTSSHVVASTPIASPAASSTESLPRLFTIEVGYQAPLPIVNETRHDSNATSSSSKHPSQSHQFKRSRSKRK